MMQLRQLLTAARLYMRHTHIQKQKIQLLKLIYMLLIKNAAITLTGLTVSQTYTLGAGKGGQLTANVDLKVGDNYFSIELKKSDGSPSIYYTLRIKHIPVDVYLDDLYITKKDNSNKIPFYNSSFIKTVTTYSIKT